MAWRRAHAAGPDHEMLERVVVDSDDSTKRADGSGTVQYLSSAPKALIAHYEQRQSFPGREILGRLLTEQQMRRSWTELGRHIASSTQWKKLWREIVWARYSARVDSQLHPPNEKARTKQKKQLRTIAKNANKLADALVDGPLDVRAYDLFPHDVMRILGVTNWPELTSLQRADAAWELLREWPTAPELLRELAALAKRLADEVMTRGPVMRTTRDREVRYFASVLCTYLKDTYDVLLCSTVANIASVVFGRPITKKLVENAAKPPQ